MVLQDATGHGPFPQKGDKATGEAFVYDETLAVAIGTPSDPAWNGTDPDATVISLLKAIALNTTP